MSNMKILRKTFSSGVNITGWMGLKQIKENSVLIKDLFNDTFSAEKKSATAKVETFDQAVRRLGLTEADIQKRIKKSTQIIYFCGILSLPMLIYTLYMFNAEFYLSGLVCLMLTFLLFSYVFREHFNRFQLRQRRLGCSFKEWFTATFRANSARKKT